MKDKPQSYEDFREFYEHPFIKSIARNEKWSVSDNKKMPIDMFCFEYQNRIVGALFTDSKSLVSLDHLCELLPTAANNAYFMDAITDKFVILDIEPACPADIKERLLKMPYIYGETSLSGKGIHLVFPLPECFDEYPIAQTKIVMREEHGYYEILLNHWVTFTRNQIPASIGTEDFEELFRAMASEQKESNREGVDISDLEPADIPNSERIIGLLMQQEYKKVPDDFFGDMSKFEYGYIGFLNYKLGMVLNVSAIKKAHTYSDNEKAWLLYITARDKVPYRPKHDERRTGLPWLLYLAQEIIAKNIEK